MREGLKRTVAERLAVLDLPEAERDEVIEEVAEHLQECAEELEAAGAAHAVERALAQVSDWPRLAARIRRAKEKRMSATGIVDMPSPRSTSHRRRLAWVMTVAVLVGAGAGFITSRLTPVRYRSQAVLQVVAPQVPSEYVRVTDVRSLDDRMQAVRQTVLSRTRLERVIKEFNLYQEELASTIMEEVVEQFRNDISIRPHVVGESSTQANDAITVSYTGRSPVTVMKVTEKLAAYMRDESQVEGERRAEGTASFLEAQAEEAGKRLQAKLARVAAGRAPADRRSQIETQVMEATYAKLLTDLEQGRMRVDLERRQIGEQFNLLDQARLPELPIGPTRAQYVGFGAAAGLALGILIALVWTIARLGSSNRPQPVIEVA